MVTEIDEGRGLVKTYWSDIRKRVAKVEPTFAKLVDELNPDKTFPLYLAYYPYGDLIGDSISPFIPKPEGGSYRLSDSTAPKDIIKNLGYGKNDSPLAMILDKNLEFYVDLKSENVTIPWFLDSPGVFFPFTRILSNRNKRIYTPNAVLTICSGVRSTFMLANIGCLTNHINLQRDFNVQAPPAKSLYEHWNIFKEIIDSNIINCDWRSCVVYFSEKWIDKIHNDKAWMDLKVYFHDLAWQRYEYQRNYLYYDVIYSVIKNKRNLKPNPYLADTARHLLTTALGDAPGYAPAVNDDNLPLDILQKAFTESYGLKKYFPTIMQPEKFNFENNSQPVYYSLQNPSTFVSSPKSRKVSSTLYEIHELEHIMKIFAEELANDDGLCAETIVNKMAKNVEFKYFHNESDRHKIVKPSSEVALLDERFNFINPKYRIAGAKFASDAPFLRGCIGIYRKE